MLRRTRIWIKRRDYKISHSLSTVQPFCWTLPASFMFEILNAVAIICRSLRASARWWTGAECIWWWWRVSHDFIARLGRPKGMKFFQVRTEPHGRKSHSRNFEPALFLLPTLEYATRRLTPVYLSISLVSLFVLRKHPMSQLSIGPKYATLRGAVAAQKTQDDR